MDIDVLIIGGGVAGLWLLDELQRRGHRVLLAEAHALGEGQTIAAQGIIHSGLKYTLSGALNESAKAIREMPAVWRDCLAGNRMPDLSATPVRSECCYLWRTAALSSRLGFVGARMGLRSAVSPVNDADRPAALSQCPGDVMRVDEQVVDVPGLLASFLAGHADRLVKIDTENGLRFESDGNGRVGAVDLQTRRGGVTVRARFVVLTAGAGNAALREQLGLAGQAMQRRPLHMVMARGALPALYGHCVDGAHTRVTVTTHGDAEGRTVWQLGGQLSEDGVQKSAGDLIGHARREMQDVLPGFDDVGVEWSTYRVDRAEGATPGNRRPAGPQIVTDGNVLTVWPTKLALAPETATLVAEQVTGALQSPATPHEPGPAADLPTPDVALPPWDKQQTWHA